jgi:threonine synthase
MRYVSTRGRTPPMRFKDAVLTGLAPDGGLLVPESLPDLRSELPGWRGLDYAALASRVIGHFTDDIDTPALSALVARSYAGFDHPEVAPVVSRAHEHVLELFHGPTLAFKDFGLQFLGNLFEAILTERGGELNILGATSGDTGSAAIEGVRGKAGIRIFILYPHGRTSRLQELQMTTVADANVHCLTVDGSFDDCQRLMKELMGDLQFKAAHHLGAVNSVNWARVLAQVVYYVHAALRVGATEANPVAFAVPTGNFGNAFAGYLAWRMGLPISRIVVATNENDILARCFADGTYRSGEVRQTLSPSMDIQLASNFERFVYYAQGGDASAVRDFIDQLARTGAAPMPAHEGLLTALAVGDGETLATIAAAHREDGYLLDPHSAVGVAAARRLPAPRPVVCIATAHPAKFPEAIGRVLDPALARHPRLQALRALPERRTRLPASAAAVRDVIRQHCMP